MSPQKIIGNNVLYFAGAFIAFLISSGFATGQKVLQYFTLYGYLGIAGALIMLLLFLYVGIEFMTVGQHEQFEKGSEIYTYYGGKYLGMFYDYFSIAFIYMSFFIMIASAGSILQEEYDLPMVAGGILMASCTALTVLFGLNNIVRIIGKIGLVVMVLFIALGLIAIAQNPSGIPVAEKLIPEMDTLRSSTNWFFAAMSYVGFSVLWLATFLTSMGKIANNQTEARMGAILGATGFSLAVIMMALGLMANIEAVSKAIIPSLYLAANIHPWLAIIFSIIIIFGIYTTAVPLLWSVSSRFAEDKTAKFRVLTIGLAIVGTFVALGIPFNKLVNVLYVSSGYVGFALIFLMLYKTITRRKQKS